MYVSQITFNFDPQRFEQVNALAQSVVGQLRSVEGCRQVVVLCTATDKLTSLVTYETRVQAEAATPTIAALFNRLAPYLTVLPQRQIHPALVYEQF